jgi:uncharacterized SAM-binding protein YcdF (DUF218 family)
VVLLSKEFHFFLMPQSQRRPAKKKWILTIAGAAIVAVSHTAHSIYHYGKITTDKSAQGAIVLGAASWHGTPSPVFQERINHAINLYHCKQVQKLLFTGGVGKGDTVAESITAKQFAITQGVLEADILTEEQSNTTYKNLYYARQVARQHNLQTFLLVSDPLHMQRSMAIAQDLGLNVQSSPTPTTRYVTFSSQWGFLLRETYFYLDYSIFRRFSYQTWL